MAGLGEILKRAVPVRVKARAVDLVLSSPAPRIALSILGPYVRVDGCRFAAWSPELDDVKSYFLALIGAHESAERRLARRYLVPRLPLVDLGAGIGVVGLCTSKTLNCSQYIGVEANPAAYGLLRRNIALNGLPGQAINAALWYDEDTDPIVPERPPEATWVALTPVVRALGEPHLPGTALPAITLREVVDRFLSEMTTFQLLCDIEGFEWQLFEREGELLASRYPRVVVELEKPVLSLKPTATRTPALDDK